MLLKEGEAGVFKTIEGDGVPGIYEEIFAVQYETEALFYSSGAVQSQVI